MFTSTPTRDVENEEEPPPILLNLDGDGSVLEARIDDECVAKLLAPTRGAEPMAAPALETHDGEAGVLSGYVW